MYFSVGSSEVEGKDNIIATEKVVTWLLDVIVGKSGRAALTHP